jgi:hypothetical protein
VTDKKKDQDRIEEMRSIAYMRFIDAFKGLKQAMHLIDERVQKEGPTANYSMNSDLLSWSQEVWKYSNMLYSLDQVAEDLRRSESDKAKPKTGKKTKDDI